MHLHTRPTASERFSRRGWASIAAAALLFLAGCATREERRAAELRAMADANRECVRLLADPMLNRIRGKVALVPLMNRPAAQPGIGHATAEDKPVIELWVNAKQDCWDAGKRWRAMEPPVFIDVVDAAVLLENGLIAELYLGQVSYPEFTRERGALIDAAQTAWNQLESAATRFRQLQLRDQFIADCHARFERDGMMSAIEQMQAQFRDPTKCHLFGNSACT